jgi:hypothetical protein
MRGDEVVGIIAVIGLFSVPIVWTIAHYCHLSWKSWHEISLKREMVQRGYTADQIMAVLAAQSDAVPDRSALSPATTAQPTP